MIIVNIIWILLVIIILVFFYYYNRFAILTNRINNSAAQIDVQLKKRADLVPNLVEAVKGYMKHEKEIIKEVTNARKALISAKDFKEKVKAGDKLSNVLKTIFAIAENYPKLRANENFLQLQQELTAIEDKIAYARQFYNDSILDYNNLCNTIPGKWFALLFGKKEKEYLKIEKSSKEAVKLKF